MDKKNKEILEVVHKINTKNLAESNAVSSKRTKLSKKEEKMFEEADVYAIKEYEDQCKIQAIWILREERAKLRKMEAKLFKEEGELYQALADDLTD